MASKIVLKGIDGKINKIISSDLKRCRLPAKALAEMLDLPLETTPLLREMNFGDWEGRSWDDLWRESEGYRIWCENWQTAACPGGESLPDMTARIERFLNNEKSGTIFIVTHAGVIRALKHLLTGKALELVFREKIEYWRISGGFYEKNKNHMHDRTGQRGPGNT